MILRIEDIKNICSNILQAVDSNELSKITETLELIVKDKILYINVTNKEYFVSFKIPLFEDIDFHATVNAHIFLKLISKTTVETIEMSIVDSALIIKGNGTYSLPLIYDGEELLELTPIELINTTASFEIKTNILKNIYKYNTSELNKGAFVQPVQKLYYIDENGAITFTSGACVNSFSLPCSIKLLLNSKVVKLFDALTDDVTSFTMSQDTASSNNNQTKVRFEDSHLCITSLINADDDLLNSVPVEAIREKSTQNYNYTVTLNRNELLQAIERLIVFVNNNIKPYAMFEFNSDNLVIYDCQKINFENITYTGNPVEDSYCSILDLLDIKQTLSALPSDYITIKFGNKTNIVINMNNVDYIIPECVI